MDISFSIPEPFKFTSLRLFHTGEWIVHVTIPYRYGIGGEGWDRDLATAIKKACDSAELHKTNAERQWALEEVTRETKKGGVKITLADLGL